jgi:hypothetical protein
MSKTYLDIEKEKKSYQMQLTAIDGKYWSICLLGKNMIVSERQFEKLKNQYTWTTWF